MINLRSFVFQRNAECELKTDKRKREQIRNNDSRLNQGNTLRGLAFITSESCLLKPIAVAGNPSVTRLTQSSWTWKKFS